MEPNDTILLGDSIAGRLRHMRGIDIHYCPGATTSHWLNILKINTVKIDFSMIKAVFLMFGTNDIGNNIQIKQIVENFKTIINQLMSHNNIKILICGIISRPIDGPQVTLVIKALNIELRKLTMSDKRLLFVKTYGPFNKGPNIAQGMYNIKYKTGRYDLIHPSYLGACRLRQIITSTRSHYFGKSFKKSNQIKVLKPKI